MNSMAVFGSEGYLGRQLAHYFSQKGIHCTGYDVPACDVTQPTFWDGFDPNAYDAILFFAGLTGTERSFGEAHRYLAVNEGGLLHLLKILAPLGSSAPKIIYPSTRLVYRGADRPLSEDAEKETKTIYAVNKLACEGFLAAYAGRYGLPYAVLRICVPYGNIVSSNYSYGTIGLFLRQIAAGEPIRLFGGGTVRRTFTHVNDICRAVECLVESSACGVYNVGGDDYSLAEAAALVVARKGGSMIPVPWPPEALCVESGSTVFDSSRLDALFHLAYGHLADCQW